MKCPLFYTARLHLPREITWDKCECLKEECAWWDYEIGQCSMVTLARQAHNIYSVLDLIGDKMPHELQFRK
jgi:hypothetical protein